MKITAITPRGYCMGVVNAIQIVKNTVKNNPDTPIYLLGMLVHNEHVSRALTLKGVTVIDRENFAADLATLPKGIVILSAHGSASSVAPFIISLGHQVIDAVCKDVVHNFDLIKEQLNDGHEVIFIGKKGHPEAVATVAIDPSKIHLIESLTDVDTLVINDSSAFLTNQTTLSMIEVFRIHEKLLTKYPSLNVSNDLCDATQSRQEALFKIPEDVDGLLVVGDTKSNNSKMLAQIASGRGISSLLIGSASELDLSWVRSKHHIAITSGASTPTYLTKQVIEFLTHFDALDTHTQTLPAIDYQNVL